MISGLTLKMPWTTRSMFAKILPLLPISSDLTGYPLKITGYLALQKLSASRFGGFVGEVYGLEASHAA
jgi:hypothetical protein